MRRALLIAALSISTLASTRALAQANRPSALIPRLMEPLQARETFVLQEVATPADSAKASKHSVARFVYSVGGLLVGSIAAAGLVIATGPDCPGLFQPCAPVDNAAFAGMVLGSAYGASIPRFINTCSSNRRLGYALLGAGAAALVVIPTMRDGTTAAHLLIFPAAATIGVNLCKM